MRHCENCINPDCTVLWRGYGNGNPGYKFTEYGCSMCGYRWRDRKFWNGKRDIDPVPRYWYERDMTDTDIREKVKVQAAKR